MISTIDMNSVHFTLELSIRFCLKDSKDIKEDYFNPFLDNSKDLSNDDNIKYKLSFEKICRMYKNAVENGFASYAEA